MNTGQFRCSLHKLTQGTDGNTSACYYVNLTTDMRVNPLQMDGASVINAKHQTFVYVSLLTARASELFIICSHSHELNVKSMTRSVK